MKSEVRRFLVVSGRRAVVLLALATSAAALASCGDAGASATGTDRLIATASPTAQTAVEAQTAEMTLAEVLRSDRRFSRFRAMAEATTSAMPGRPTWLDIWDWPAGGDNGDGVTVFVPTDEAFETLDPGILQALDSGSLTNEQRYQLLGNHYVHRLFPRAEFEQGPVQVWRGSAELTLEPLTFGGHEVVETDLRALNGYIHVIAGVVIPDDLLDMVTD